MSPTTGTVLFPGLEQWSPRAFRQCLKLADFRPQALDNLGRGPVGVIVRDRAILSTILDPASPLTLAIRLFLWGEALSPDQALRLLGPEVEELIRIGFIRFDGGGVRSRFSLQPQATGWTASDFLERQSDPSGDFVMGYAPSSQLLASLAPPCAAGEVLELGCGVGSLSQRYRQAGARVVATDINPRALALAAFNARLAGVEGIELRQGDLFEPVAGERFDVIVANLPYVQSPGGSLVFRESAEGEETICARALRGFRDHLKPGGIAVALINWCHTRDDDWDEVPLQWAPAPGLRRWLFQTDCSAPAHYARPWIQSDGRLDAEGRLAEFERWMAFYRDRGIQRISTGFIAVQACEPGEEWVESESRAIDGVTAEAGAELARTMANRSWLRRAGSTDLLDVAFRPAPGIRAEVAMALEAKGAWQRRTIRLTSPGRLSYDGQVDENLLRLLEIQGGGGTARAMLEEIRRQPGFAAEPDLDGRIAGLVRELVRHGLLVPPDPLVPA